jgi:hypothetical protein
MANSVRSLGLTQVVCDKPTRAQLKSLAERNGITLVELLRQVAATYDQMPILLARSKTLAQIENMSDIDKAISYAANAMHIKRLPGVRAKSRKILKEGRKTWEALFGNDPRAEKKGYLLAQHYELLKEST